jgi:hypothetical protein
MTGFIFNPAPLTIFKCPGPKKSINLPADPGEQAESECHKGGMLRTLLRHYCRPMLLTYGLFNLENLLQLIQPLVLGIAINGLLNASYRGITLFIVSIR